MKGYKEIHLQKQKIQQKRRFTNYCCFLTDLSANLYTFCFSDCYHSWLLPDCSLITTDRSIDTLMD